MTVDFRDLRLPISLFGFPDLEYLDEGVVVVSDWSHRLVAIDTDAGELLGVADLRSGTLPPVGALASLRARPGSPPACVVATRAASAFVWTPAQGALERIFPHGYGPVNCVAFGPDGADILIGTGYYPLSGALSEPAVERWTLDPEPSFCCRQKLVGTAVDRLDWDEESGTIVAHVGAVTQDRGYLIRLEQADLRIIEIVETDYAMVRNVRLSPGGDWITLVHREGIEVRAVEDLASPHRRIPVSADTLHVAIDESGGYVLLSNGDLYKTSTGVVRSLPVLPRLAATAFGPSGSIFGIGVDGGLRRWDLGGPGFGGT